MLFDETPMECDVTNGAGGVGSPAPSSPTKLTWWERQTEDQKACVDHCHSTGSVRGILCNGCNTGIGRLKDSPKFLQKAIEYLMLSGEFDGPPIDSNPDEV